MALGKRTPYGSLIEHHLRIGDTEFYVPPTAISVHRQMKNQRVQILRARNSLPKESGYFDRVIELTLFFPNMDSINTELRPLLAQVKKCPFLPIENTYLNDIQKIDAVTIAGVTVQTTPGFPHTLQAQIQCYAFEPYSYIADAEDRTYDEMFDWDLFRWYYSRNLDPELEGSFHTYYEPIYSDLDNSYKFRIAAEDDLAAMKEWKDEKRKMIKDYTDAQKANFFGDKEREAEFFKKYDKMYQNAMFEYNISYEDWDIPGLVLMDFAVGFENAITSQQIQGDQSPTHQYMGSQDTIMTARFRTTDVETIASIEGMVTRSTYLIRNYHKEIANGFLEFDHQLARLFGVKNVTIEDMQTTTVEGYPDTYDVTLTMIAYNRVERKLNEVQWMSETATWEIDKYENQGFWSLLTSLNPYNWIPDWNDPNYEPSDWYKSNALYRWGRFVADRPVFNGLLESMKTYFTGQKATPNDMRGQDIKQAVYDEAVRQIFRAAEVYPDLELPTYGEVAAAGFHIENSNNGVFVDPDFFIKYQKGTMFWENLAESIEKDYQTTLRDGTGGEATMSGGKVTSTNDVTKKEMEQSKKDYGKAHEESQVNYAEVPKELVDQGNIKKDQMEALIREKSQQFNINQNLPLAFARTMDEELKQFFDKGTNAKQGKVVNPTPGAPIMMNSDLKFYTNKDGKVDGEYIGVMKVRKMYGSNANLLGKNIEYNVETGVRKMSELQAEVKRINAKQLNGGKKIYNEKNVFDLFGLKQSGFDNDKAEFAGVIMLYMGYEKEYMALLKDNKKPPSRIVNLVKKVITDASNKDQWSAQQIQKNTKDLPIKDFKTVGATPNATQKNMDVKDFGDDAKIHKGMMHDMLRYDQRGRLVRAFPTFFLSFVDEGRFIDSIKLSDQFFNYKAVMDIMYTNSRKEASSTLVLEMCNVYGTLDDAEKGMDLTATTYSEVFKTMTMPGAVAQNAERSRHRNQNYYKSIMLRTGTRIHFRMGYGSNPMNMPTIMNGTITSIQNNTESITVIAQDDGIELTNKIRADVNETTDGGFLFSKKEPTEIVDELLTDSQGFFKNLWAGLSNEEYENHSLGIMHFGNQQDPQGWTQGSTFFGGLVSGAAGGAMGGGVAAGPAGMVIGGIGGGLIGGIAGFIGGAVAEGRKIGEINMNVYQTTGLTNEEHDGWWNGVKDAFGIGQADEAGINIGLFDKSVWDVLNICASMGDDHIVAVHPFGFRNTIYSGKTYFPLHYDYVVEGESVKGTAVKPFRQFHVYDSETSILDNTITASEDNVRTVAVGVYMNEGEMDTTSPVYVDTDIWPEKQRVVNIDTTMNAQGVRLIENIPLIGGLLNKPMKWYFDEGVAIKIAARGLSDYVRDMYDGYLTVMGDPSVKPFDQMWMNDTYNSMSGPADIKEVTQIMNHQVGYITMLKPDAVVVNSDRRSMGFLMACQAMAGSALITYTLRKLLRTSKYAGHLPIMNAFWSLTKNSFARMKERFDASKVKAGELRDKLTGKKPKNADATAKADADRKGVGAKAKDLARWSKNGMLKQLEKLTGEQGKQKLEDMFKNARQFGSNVFKGSAMKSKATGMIASGSRKAAKIFKGVGGVAKAMWAGGHALAGPIGWLAAAVEALVVHIVSSTIGEVIERWLFMRQACLIAPLTKSGLEYTAGINGHKGSVMGDSPDAWQNIMTNKFSATILGFIGVDAWQYRQDYREGEVKSMSDGGLNVSAMATDMFNRFRKAVPLNNDVKARYDKDRKAALDQISKRLQILSEREKKAVYEQEEFSWEDWIGKIGGKIKGWFGALWDKVKSFFGNKDDGACIPKGDVSTGGKAKGLSKYFDVIGPKIEAESKAQGIPAYAEILKALTMQESGGNYIKLPDVMQSSESMGKPIGYIKNVDQSIKQGVTHFKNQLAKANGDIKLVLQSYNFGGGFIDYCMKNGGKYTYELAYSFSESMVKKVGRISRVPPGYGDSKYVERVLRYYDGALPNGECEKGGGGAVTGGASSCPSVFGSEGKSKYHSNGGDLVELGSGPWGIIIVGGGGTSKVRQGTKEALKAALTAYGKKINVTSGWRPGDRNWHGTGWAVDLDTPNTMRNINGKMRFPEGGDKNDARKLADCCIQAGFRGIYFGDWDIVQEMNAKYGAGTCTYDPGGHWNHFHCSYPVCKK